MSRSCVKVDSVDMLKFTHTQVSISLVFGLTGFGFHINNIYIYFTCVLDFIHTYYASSKEFKYHVLVFIQVWEKSDFHFKVWFLENTDFVSKPNFYITKMVQIACNMC